MLNNIPPKPTSAKQHAQLIVRNIINEPFEVGKTAVKQITGNEQPNPDINPPDTSQESKYSQNQNQEEKNQNDALKSQELLKQLESELKEISKKDTFSDLQKKISEGADIFLEDYPNLSLEEKQVLKAQMEAVKLRNDNSQDEKGVLIEPQSKKPRNFLFGLGKKPQVKGPQLTAERQKQRVENVMSPSG